MIDVEVLFWLFNSIVVYVYLGYPALILGLGYLVANRVKKKTIYPSVDFLIAAYNEDRDIEEKLLNTLALDYPKDKLRIVVVSDGSTDRTDDIVRSYREQGVELFRVEGRKGKTEARNQAVEKMESEIIVFSDATTVYKKDAIKKLVQNFNDPSVGQVSGNLKYIDFEKSGTGLATKIYWQYETMIKENQTRIKTLTGAIGCINAFRRELYTRLPSNIIEDFTEPLMILLKGKRIVFEKEAVAYEKTTTKPKQEINMRIRVIRGGMTGMLYARKLLNPFKYPFESFQLISHKILRWMVPIFCILIFICSVWLSFYHLNNLYKVFLFLQIIFYCSALLGVYLEQKNVHLKILSITQYFCVVNFCALIALWKTMTSTLESTWETDR